MPFNDFAARRHCVGRCFPALIVASVLASALPAQAVQPQGEDAATVPRGMLRARLLPTWTRVTDRWTVRDGERRTIPYGGELASESLGVAQIPTLADNERLIRELSGRTDFRLNAGRSVAAASARSVAVPIAIEYGVTDRFTIGVTVPVVQTRTRFSYALNGGDADVFNVGVAPSSNPGRDQLLMQLSAAITRLTTCTGATPPPDCGAIDPAAATAARNALTATRNGIEALYGAGATAGQRLIPVAGSEVQQQLEARLEAISTQTRALLGAAYAIGARPAGAAGPAGTALLDELFAAAPYDSIGQTSRFSIGDVEIGAKLGVLDTRVVGADSVARGMRVAISGLVRFGTGTSIAFDAPYASGTGDGQMDVGGGAFVDLTLTPRFALTASGRYTVQLGETDAWYPDANGERDVLTPRRATAQLGDLLAAELIPRFLVSRLLSLDAHYALARSGAATHTEVLPLESSQPTPSPVTTPATTVHHIGLGVTYSTLEPWTRGRARLPLDLVVSHLRAIASSGGPALKTSRTQIQLRVYYRLAGR